jgi:hypothetical protein
MKKLFLGFALLLAIGAGSTPGTANDSAISGVSGTPGNLKATQLAGEHSSVRMVRETIAMTLGQTDYVTDARFEFHNGGAATTVKMGFPESGGGDIIGSNWRRKTSFKSFRTWVDGREIKATRMIAKSSSEEDFTAFWVKTVRFARGQTRHVRVLYRSALGGSTEGDFIYYDFTGGNWKGKVNESLLSVTFTKPGDYLLMPDYGTAKPTPRRSGNTFHYRWRNWQAQEGFRLAYMKRLPGALTLAATRGELTKLPENLAKARAFTIAAGDGNFDPYSTATTSRTDYLWRDGHAFASIRAFYEGLLYDYTNRQTSNSAPRWNGDFAWDAKTQTAVVTTGGAHRKVIRIRANSPTFHIGKTAYRFSASPFFGGQGEDRTLYVPLGSLVAALGGQVETNVKTRRVWYEVPL